MDQEFFDMLARLGYEVTIYQDVDRIETTVFGSSGREYMGTTIYRLKMSNGRTHIELEDRSLDIIKGKAMRAALE